MANLSRGDLVSGVVKALKPYGAFIEVGGMSGLLHISQISYDRIEDMEKVLQPGMAVKCMIIDHDKVNGRIALSTKTLEPEPGDMLKDPAMVFEKAEATAAAYHARMETERQAREKAARDIVMGLGDSLDDLGGGVGSLSSSSGSDLGGDGSRDPLQDVSDSLDSLLS
jgi:small subunit ribosomal protein S1